ncbi:MAG TPA: MogA/MoaB family molybdenum cofactor biosynthesis protein [Bdellovibrionota bacterium]|nr:MogA/MoaB family molybdenum cofactor biosynthesis protein [Bdellovibrionota bacterium]
MLSLAIVTISDRVSRGEREDKSGLVIKEMFSRTTAKLVSYEVIPDEKEIIAKHLKKLADQMHVGIVMTTGGTGFSPRDITPEATRTVIEREVPGFGEVMRVEGYRKTPLALLSRGIAGLRGQTLIINLPGSSKGVRESLEIILPVLEHGLGILKGQELHDDYKSL